MAEDDGHGTDHSNHTRPGPDTIEAIEQVLYLMHDPVFAYDKTGTLIYVNHAYKQLLGRDLPDGVLGKKIYDLEPDKRDLNKQMVEANLSRSPTDPMLIIESPTVDQDGQTRWYEWRNMQQFDDEGNVVLVVGISRDITRQRLAELQTERITSRLEESNRDLLEFAQVASHDLREPLRKVAAFSERIERKLGDDLDDKVADYMVRMNGAVGRMQGLIDDLLTFSRVNSRAGEMKLTDLDAIVADTLSDLEIAISEAGASITVDSLPTISVDPSQMNQLFQNLIANALKFRRPGVQPEISITCAPSPAVHHLDAAGEAACYDITVRDNGIGFDQQYASKIFAPFQRLHGKSEYEGSGVGLSVCRRIVERHQGKIWADGGAGIGASFTFRLPAEQVDIQADDHPSNPDISGLGIEHSVIDTLAA